MIKCVCSISSFNISLCVDFNFLLNRLQKLRSCFPGIRFFNSIQIALGEFKRVQSSLISTELNFFVVKVYGKGIFFFRVVGYLMVFHQFFESKSICDTVFVDLNGTQTIDVSNFVNNS